MTVVVSPDPVARSVVPARSARTRVRATLAVSAILVMLSASACGLDVQTTQPYTPADGINFDAGPAGQVKVRNLMVLSRSAGTGFLSASLVADPRDTLTGVTATPMLADGSAGQPLAVTVPESVALDSDNLVVLTDRAPILLAGPDLKAGLEVKIVLTFTSSGKTPAMTVPVIDGNEATYRTVSPAPAPTV